MIWKNASTVDQDLMDNKLTKLEKEILKMKLLVYQKDSEMIEKIRIQQDYSKQTKHLN